MQSSAEEKYSLKKTHVPSLACRVVKKTGSAVCTKARINRILFAADIGSMVLL